MYICTFVLHIQAYTCAEKKIYVKKAQEISRVDSTHATYADNYINKNVYTNTVSKVNVMVYMHCMIPGQRKV